MTHAPITWRQHGNRLIGTTPGPTYSIVSTPTGYVLARDGVEVERRWERTTLANVAERLWAKERENVGG